MKDIIILNRDQRNNIVDKMENIFIPVMDYAGSYSKQRIIFLTDDLIDDMEYMINKDRIVFEEEKTLETGNINIRAYAKYNGEDVCCAYCYREGQEDIRDRKVVILEIITFCRVKSGLFKNRRLQSENKEV
jgi:hypothetical protein